MTDRTKIINHRHPLWLSDWIDYEKWSLCYAGGSAFVDRYLEKFDTREDNADFSIRKSLTPTPTYAKAAINGIRNAIFQRLADVSRAGGSDMYHRAMAGENGGVDRRGSTMNFFLGQQPLTDLLVYGRVGIFVDMPVVEGQTLADVGGNRPYIYSYSPLDILNWDRTYATNVNEFSAILLRDNVMQYSQDYWLPTATVTRYRHMFIDPLTGKVNIQFYDEESNPIDADGNASGPIELELTRIPFVMLELGDSLIRDIADHQIALLNLCSSDVSYALRSNFPFYVEQRDARAAGTHVKRINTDGTASEGGQGSADERVKVGVTHGRYYDKDTNPPGFIAPPSEPLMASLKLQEKLEDDIRKLVNLAVVNLGTRVSGEAKKRDNEGLEAGLSFIGLVLEGAERKIAEYWAAYEDRTVTRRKIAAIKYPDTYSLRTDSDRIEQAKNLSELMFAVPGQTVKKEIAKSVTTALFGGKVKVETLQKIHKEIDDADYTTSDPDIIIRAKDAGLVGEQTASVALGFDENEYLTAREDHVERISRIAEAQSAAANTVNAARGVSDMDGEPGRSPSEEKELSRATDDQDTTRPRVRGEGTDNED
jgi:hypothetical protein